jgi:tetratricopeptide (TPR) repeat protein
MGNFFALLAALVLGLLAHIVSERTRSEQLASRDPNELMYLPESRVLKAASLGFSNLFADIIWLRAIQYYGEHRLTDRNYPQAERLFRTIYDLDPAFKGATRFGAIILAQDARDPDGAIELLERAEQDHPEVWEYPFDQGFIHQTIRKAYAEAAEDYHRASLLPGAPDLAARLAGYSYVRLGDRSASRDVWSSILADPPNEMMRRIAERGLRNIAMEEAEEKLTEQVAKYKAKTGRWPKEWKDVHEAGLLDVMPVEPYGGRYFIDPETGSVHATTSIDREMKRQRSIVASALEVAHEKMGDYPGTLELLVRMGLLDQAPWRPLGVALTYDPASGAVAWDPPWPMSKDEVEE